MLPYWTETYATRTIVLHEEKFGLILFELFFPFREEEALLFYTLKQLFRKELFHGNENF